jgi:cobalt transporter subunit CbtB
MNTRTVSAEGSLSWSKDRVAVGSLALSVGLLLLFFVGFAPISAIHNAAHDTRHSAAFPCH